MSDTTAAFLQAGTVVLALALCYRPVGDLMARVFGSTRHLRVERGLYRVMGVDGDAEQTWSGYLRAVLAFSAVSVLFLYAFQRLQSHLLLSLGFPAVKQWDSRAAQDAMPATAMIADAN